MCWCFIHYWNEKCTVKQWNIFPSVLTALNLLSQFSVGLHSVGHFCLVSLQADHASRQHMFQFAVRGSMHLGCVYCSYEVSLTTFKDNGNGFIRFTDMLRIQQTCCSVHVKSSTDCCWQCEGCYSTLILQHTLDKNCKDSDLVNKATVPCWLYCCPKHTVNNAQNWSWCKL